MKKTAALFFALALLAPLAVNAQDIHDINIMNFKMSTDPQGLITQDSAYRLGHLKWYAGGMLSYVNTPLYSRLNSDVSGAIVEHQALMDLAFSIGLYKYFQVGVQMQAVMYQSGDNASDLGYSGSGDLQALAISDLRVTPKVLILKPEQYGFGLAFLPVFTLPIATSGANAGDPSLTFEPRFAADKVIYKGIRLVGNVGYRVRKATQVANLMVDDEIMLSFGAEIPVAKRISVVAELFLNMGVNDSKNDSDGGIDEEEIPFEAVVAARWRHQTGFIFTGGIGRGLTAGYGSPKLRLFVAAGYVQPAKATPAKTDNDSDKDGIPNLVDKCPNEPEDKNGFEDDDGCPDATKDTDKDGIPDMKDKCPTQPEDKNGIKDDDGCPDGNKDTDKDGIPDVKDKCPKEPEDKNGFEDDDGCPDATKDTDKDGIPDMKDANITEPEDKDGFQDEDGAPDPDNDGDGFCDPWVQKKGLQKKYAHICKGVDACPNEKENINGVKDDDGCPDKGKALAVITKDNIVIMNKVYFNSNRSTLLKQSYPILNIVVKVLKTHTRIELLEVQGHTDDTGDDSKNMKLSQARANSVRRYLISKGISASRLKAVGYGETRALQDCTGQKGTKLWVCRSKNRRVAFKIVKITEKTK